MTEQQAVDALDSMSGADPETAHELADEILLLVTPVAVAEAYARLVARASWWATA